MYTFEENLQSMNFNFGSLNNKMPTSLPSDVIDHVPCLKSDLISTDSAIKSPKDISFNQFTTSEYSGADSKSKNTKSVSWASELTTSTSTFDDDVEEQCLQLITALRQEKSFVDTPSVQAAKWMIENDSDSNSIVELITIYLHLKHERYPSGKEIMDMCEREGLTEKSVTSLITKHCLTNSNGLSTLKSIVKTFHANDSTLEQESSPTSTENLNSISLTLDSSPAVTASLSSSSEIHQCNKNEMQSIFREEQKNFLKLEALKKEQSYLKHSLTCLICKQRQIDTMLLPCGHVVLCSVCSESCFSCPVCKKTALAEVKTYLS